MEGSEDPVVQLKAQLAKSEKERDLVMSKMKSLVPKYKELQMQVGEREAKIEELLATVASKAKECDNLFSSVSRLQDDVKSKEEQLEAWEAESRDSEDRVKQMTKDIIDLNRRRQEDVETISALRSSLQAKETEKGARSSLEEEVQLLREKIASRDKEVEALKNELEARSSQYDSDIKDLQLQLSNNRSHIEDIGKDQDSASRIGNIYLGFYSNIVNMRFT
jgi:chromosome segregation ATPase